LKGFSSRQNKYNTLAVVVSWLLETKFDLPVILIAEPTTLGFSMPRPKISINYKRWLQRLHICSAFAVFGMRSLRESKGRLLLQIVMAYSALHLWISQGNWRIDHHDYARFDLDSYDDAKAKLDFRFTIANIHRLMIALHIPHVFRDRNRCLYSGEMGFCLLLRRLVYPNRLCDLIPDFGISEPQMSLLLELVVQHIIQNFKHLLDDPSIWSTDWEYFSDVIHSKLDRYDSCWGFIDGTLRPTCRPMRRQRDYYSGLKHMHGIKFLSITTPSGLFAFMWGPVVGKRHDGFLTHQSNILHQLQATQTALGERNFCVYGDLAFPLCPQLMKPFAEEDATEEEKACNEDMKAGRITVEWGFRLITSLWSYLDFKRGLKVLQAPVGNLYLCGALLANCHTCIERGNLTSFYFDCFPPELEEYLSRQGVADVRELGREPDQ
jgi:hypothetical protein